MRRAAMLAAAALIAAGTVAAQAPSLPAHPLAAVTGVEMLTSPIPDGPNAGQLRRGRALAIEGDCLSCHLRPGGPAFAGGLPLKTPFGTIYSPNITSDPDTGIGKWTPYQFWRAMHEGVAPEGNLYPAFPYPWFTKISRADSDAIFAYLRTVPAVRYTEPANRLPFPLNIRFMVKGWNLLFFRPEAFRTDPRHSAEWNRGAYLVNGPGHCGACHTPKNFLGADKGGRQFQGGVLENWTAPDLTGNPRSGLARWSAEDIAEYLKTGRNAHAGAGGQMAEVVSYSTSLMNDADRHAIGIYLKSLVPSGTATPAAPPATAMKRGAEIYSDACSSCHLANGVGQPRYIPPLGPNAVAQQDDTTGLLHIILAGSRMAPTPTRPSPLTMPSFAWKLSDAEIADVATYVRNSWGNRAAPIVASDVAKVRRKLDLRKVRLTANSGDHG